MRAAGAAALVLIAATAAGGGAARLRITIERVLPSAEIDGPPAERTWDVTGRVHAVGCSPRAVHVRTGVDNNDNGFVYAFGRPGAVVRVRAWARCGGVVVRARRDVRIPKRCDGNALRVLSVHGRVRLRAGTHVPDGAQVTVRRGWAKVGEPECDGFRMLLLRGRTTVAAYRSGTVSRGRSIVEVGDSRAPAFSPFAPLVVAPRTDCRQCGFVAPSTFSVRARGRRAGIRVYAGSVEIRAAALTRVARAPDELWLACGARRCRISARRWYQPGEPLTAAPRPLRRFRRFVAGARPPRRLLAPPRAHVDTLARTESGELVVTWSRETRRRSGYVVPEHGVVIWLRTRRGRRAAADLRSTPSEPDLGATVADVTGDGHADVIVARATGGSAGCGTNFALVAARVVWRRSFCEGGWRVTRGRLVTGIAIGPCPYRRSSAHCRGGVETTTYRWDSRRLVPARVVVTCDLERLDPAHGCRARSR